MSDGHRVLESVRRLVRMLRVSDGAAQQQAGVSAAQLFVLYELGKTPSMSLGELSERTHTDQSSVSAVVTRLVDAGLVSRERAGHDARRLVLDLTRAGRATLKRAPAVAQEQLLDAVESLSSAEQKKFADTFTQILDAMGADKHPPMIFEEDETDSSRRKPRRN
jgi:DNA-binding MarR family transcriptional regulator